MSKVKRWMCILVDSDRGLCQRAVRSAAPADTAAVGSANVEVIGSCGLCVEEAAR